MYSNNIVNFQESTTILNASTKKSGNLLKAPRIYEECSPLYIYIYIYWSIGLAVKVFAKGLADWGSVPDQVIPKTQKMVVDASLLNTQHYKVWIKGKVEQSGERSSALPYTLML